MNLSDESTITALVVLTVLLALYVFAPDLSAGGWIP